MSNEKNYKVRIHKLSKYHGPLESEHFTIGKIHEGEYVFIFSDYKEALNKYRQECTECADQSSMSIAFTHTYTIQLIDAESKNPNKSHKDKSLIVFQLTMSNL